MLRHRFEAPAEEGTDAGGGPDPSPVDSSPEPSVPSAPPSGAPPSSEGASEAGATMFDAMWGEKGLQSATEPRQRDEQGRFASQKPADKKPAEDTSSEAKTVAPKPPKPKEDDLTRPLDDKVAPETQQRFQKLVSTLKERDKALQAEQQGRVAAERRVNEFTNVLKEAGASAEDFAVFVELTSAMRRGDHAKAKNIVLGLARELSIASGETILPSNDVLAEFPDLADKVSNLQMTEQAALEVARARRIQGAQQRTTQAAQQHQAISADFHQNKQVALNTIARMVEHWKSTDIDFARKEAKIAERVQRLRSVHPSQWPAKVKELYDDLTDAATTFGSSVSTADGPRPLRGGGAPSKTSKAPANAYEAMWGEPRPA